MSRESRFVRLEATEGGLRVLAPAVGWCDELPAAGTVVRPGSGVGRLRVLNRSFRLELPEGGAGRVAAVRERRAVGYGEELFQLHGALLDESKASAPSAGGADDLPAGCRALTAPTDGVFYRAPEPGAPPFVEPGQRVTEGQAIGLIEVMKTFNQIVYGGPGWPPAAEVVEVRCPDGAEISAGQVLLLVR